MSELDIEGLFYATTPLYLHNTKLHQNVIKQPKEKKQNVHNEYTVQSLALSGHTKQHQAVESCEQQFNLPERRSQKWMYNLQKASPHNF